MADFQKYIRIDVTGPDKNGHVNAELTPDNNVKPIVTARWVPTSECWHEYPFYKCSACGATSGFHSHFCPNCGAEMRAANDRPYEGTDSSTPLRGAHCAPLQNDEGGEGD